MSNFPGALDHLEEEVKESKKSLILSKISSMRFVKKSKQSFLLLFLLFIISCVKQEEATIKLDPRTVETCLDGIQNQGETDVDCGGANCDPCLGKMKATIEGKSFVNASTLNVSVNDTLQTLYMSGSSSAGDTTVSLLYSGAFTTGTHPVGGSVSIIGLPLYNDPNGTITFTKFDTFNKVFDGTFSFSAVEINSGDTIKVTNGMFTTVGY